MAQCGKLFDGDTKLSAASIPQLAPFLATNEVSPFLSGLERPGVQADAPNHIMQTFFFCTHTGTRAKKMWMYGEYSAIVIYYREDVSEDGRASSIRFPPPFIRPVELGCCVSFWISPVTRGHDLKEHLLNQWGAGTPPSLPSPFRCDYKARGGFFFCASFAYSFFTVPFPPLKGHQASISHIKINDFNMKRKVNDCK